MAHTPVPPQDKAPEYGGNYTEFKQALERLLCSVANMEQSVDRAIVLTMPFLVADPRQTGSVPQSTPSHAGCAQPANPKSQVTQLIDHVTERLQNLFVLTQQLGSNLDT